MIEAKNFSGKLNRDDSYYAVPSQGYVDALNITHDAIEGSNDSVITNVVANRMVDNPYIVPVYKGQPYNFVAVVKNNGNGTQTVTFTFDELPGGTSALTKSYFNGTTWVNDTGGFTSPQSFTIPEGDYEYRVEIEPSNIVINLEKQTDSETNKTIGAYGNVLRNTVIFFNWNEAGYHSVLEYNHTTREVNKIFLNLIDSDTDVLGFTESGKISSINVFNRDEGDLLFFLDSLGRPTFMNIALMKADTYNPVTRDILDVAKMPPLVPPAAVYGNDTSRSVNYLRNKFFRFKYRWVYDDNFKSTTSPISQVEIPVEILYEPTTSDPTKNNIITLSMNSGGKDVKAIEVLMSYVEKTNNWSDFQLVSTVDKATETINDDEVFSFEFTNDSTYPVIDLNESILLYDYVPKKAKCQELLNGNVLGYGGITEGYNKDITPNVNNNVSTYEVAAPSSGSLTGVVNILIDNSLSQRFSVTFSGLPTPGTVINLKVQDTVTSTIYTAATYTTVFGNNAENVAAGIDASAQALNEIWTSTRSGTTVTIVTNIPTFQNKRVFYSLEITAPTTGLSKNSLPVWKWSTERNIGIAYFDKKGVTNGILYNGKITFPAYADSITNNVLLPQIETAVYHRPPIWAHSYQFYFTREETQYLYWVTNSVDFSENDYIYFEVTGLIVNAQKFPTTANVLSYSFQDGDRVRLIKRVGSDGFFDNDFDASILGLVTDPKISGVVKTGQFIKIKKSAPFENSTFTAGVNNYVIEIYRPKQQTANAENRTYFECGQQYAILDPETADRRHAGMLQDQSANLVTPATFQFREGDAYFRQRTIALSDSDTSTGYSTYNVVDRNIVDNYISAVSSLEGRANLIDINAKESYFGATIRHGQAYQPNTNVNGLNRFFPEDFLDVDYSYGSIQRMKTRDRLVRIFQELKIGSVPLFSKIGKSPSGDEIVISTNSLLNPIQYYVGDWGIGTCPESLASFNFADYFCDNNRGAICRVSNDGVTPLSIIYKVNSWANNELPLRKNTYKIYGAFEQRQNNYVVTLEATNTSEAQTLSFDEERNSFDSFLSYKPEMMCALGVLFVTFKNGVLWTHDNEPFYNNFYGVQYNSQIKGVFNKDAMMKKTYISVSEMASQVWYCPAIETSSKSYGSTKQSSNLIEGDFANFEDNFYASFLRDANSIGGINNGDFLKGNWVSVLFEAKSNEYPLNNLISLGAVSVKYNDSPLNNR
jgi:hypothetical protein